MTAGKKPTSSSLPLIGAPIARRGLMMVLSSPSGAGKTTLSRALLAADPDLALSVSVTTRPPRPGEKDGVDYAFITPEAFSTMVDEGELLEHAEVFDHHYGTPRAPVMDSLSKGKDVLFDIDWQGAQQLTEQAHDDLVKVFILPPSAGSLASRLKTRAQDSEAVVARRMSKASNEMSHYSEYDWVIVNDDRDQSLENLMAILRSERLRRHRQQGLGDFVQNLRTTANPQ